MSWLRHIHVWFQCFDDVLFLWNIAIEDEAEAADGSSKLNIGIAERDCLWIFQGRVTEDDDEKWIASVLTLFSLSLFSSIHSPVFLTQSWSLSNFQAIPSDWTFRDEWSVFPWGM